MAASLLYKLLKQPSPPSPLRILTTLGNPRLPKPPPSPNPQLYPVPDAELNPFVPSRPDRRPFSFQIYPSFPHLHHLDPVPLLIPESSSGADHSDELGSCEDSDRTVWADSVKKKRKRKMNKHKYKKLRKRLRRQT